MSHSEAEELLPEMKHSFEKILREYRHVTDEPACFDPSIEKYVRKPL